MKVEIWSDYQCPFCYIGKRRFEAALEKFTNKNEIEVIYRSFELDPNAQRDYDHDVHHMLSGKYGMSREQAIKMNEDVARQGQTAGVTFNFNSMKLTNSFDAHRLTHYAAGQGKAKEVADLLFKAAFTDAEHIGDHATLADLAAQAGLDKEAVLEMLAGKEYSSEVRSDEQEAARLGIRGVPFFVINRKYGISGAQSSEVMLDALNKAWDEDRPLTILNDAKSDTAEEACADGVCAPAKPKE